MLPPECRDSVWMDKYKYDDAERKFHEQRVKAVTNGSQQKSSLADEIAKAREHISSSLQCMEGITEMVSESSTEVTARLVAVEKENAELKKELSTLCSRVQKLESRVNSLESRGSGDHKSTQATTASPSKQVEDDDDVDMFGSESESEDEETKKIKEERVAAYTAKKTKKPGVIAKSNVVIDVKPWDDETDMKVLEKCVRDINMDGLVWGASKLVPVGYGIKKLQISCVIEDDKVSTEELQELIEAHEDHIQSMDIAAFNKV